MSRGTSSGAVCGALRSSILRPSGHIAIVPGAGGLWGSLLQGHPAQAPPIISPVCCWGRIDHRNNNDDILEHRSSCGSSGIGSSLAESDLNYHARSPGPTAASRQVVSSRPVPAHIDSSHRQLHPHRQLHSCTSRQVLRSRRPGHPSTFSMLHSRGDCSSYRFRPSSAGWVTNGPQSPQHRHTAILPTNTTRNPIGIPVG